MNTFVRMTNLIVKKIYLLLLPLTLLLSSFHPFYISVTEIKHVKEKKQLQISCKMFTDNLEDVVRKQSGKKVDLINGNEEENKKLINAYITKCLIIEINFKKLPLTFVGYEKEEDATWVYFEITCIKPPENIKIENSLLYESFAGQINMMHVTVNGIRKSFKLQNPDKIAVFTF